MVVGSLLLGAVLLAVTASAGCAAPPSKDPSPRAEADGFWRRCPCETLRRPPAAPDDEAEHERWSRLDRELVELVTEIDAMFPGGACPAGHAEAVERLLHEHARAVGENRRLNEATCDGFARWRMGREPAADVRGVVLATRLGCLRLSADADADLWSLVVVRTCG